MQPQEFRYSLCLSKTFFSIEIIAVVALKSSKELNHIPFVIRTSVGQMKLSRKIAVNPLFAFLNGLIDNNIKRFNFFFLIFYRILERRYENHLIFWLRS